MTHGRPSAPGLDGVRALAVLLVVAYHVAPSALPGGYAGVDVFFVLSGFLITALLLVERDDAGRIDLPSFWVRRARRLVPAATLMIVGVAALTAAVGRDTAAGLRSQVLGGLTWTSNWLQVADGRAYADAGEPPILNHLWSLAIEEQYYLVWPLLLVVALRNVSRRQAALVVLVAALASAGAMAWTYDAADPTRAYVGTDTHVFGLLLGSALALSGAHHLLRPGASRAVSRTGSRGLTVLGAAGAAVVVAYAVAVPWTSGWAYSGGLLLASVGAAAVVLAAANPTPIATVLGVPVLRWLGRRSYGWYLWHWPLIVVAVRIAPPSAWLWAGLAGAALGLAVAEVSYRLVEVPMRRDGIVATLRRWAAPLRRALTLRRWPSRRWFAGAVGATATFAVATAAVVTAPQHGALEGSLARGEAVLAGLSGSVADPPAASSRGAGPSARRGGAGRPSRGGARPATCRTAGPELGVSAFGDSVLVAAAPELAAAMPRLSAEAKVGWQYEDVAAAVREAAAKDRLGGVVLIGTGTNGLVDPADLTRLVRRTLVGRTVVLVTPYAPGRSWQREAVDAVRTVAGSSANVVAADWNRAVAGRDSLLSADRVHPNERGARLYVRTVRGALGGC